jgi:mgtE-like transporter
MIYSWKKIVKTGFPILTFAVLIEIFAGSILQNNQNIIFVFPIFLLSIPVLNSVSGNIGIILGARLASGLHVGYITAKVDDKRMHENLFTAIVLGLVTYTILAIIIYFGAVFSNLNKGIELTEFVGIFVSTGFLLICLVALSSIFAAFISFKRGLDPDDMVAPVVTTVGDILGISFLFLMISIFGVGI